MSFRRAQASDLAAITEIYNQAVRGRRSTSDEDEKSLPERTRWFAQFNDQYPLWVLEESGVVVAYGGLFQYNPKSGYRFAVENTVYVHEAHRGKGHGKRTLAYVVDRARELGYKYVQAKIFAHNPVSIDLHRSFGFVVDGYQHAIANLDGKFYDCVLMALHLDRGVLRERVWSESPWEAQVGYCRALKQGSRIFVSGTTSMKEGQVHGPGDVVAQTERCFEIIEGALLQLGATLEHVVRTRIFVTDIRDWPAVSGVHQKLFGAHPPTATMVEVQKLIDPNLMVEVEAEALLQEN